MFHAYKQPDVRATACRPPRVKLGKFALHQIMCSKAIIIGVGEGFKIFEVPVVSWLIQISIHKICFFKNPGPTAHRPLIFRV